VEENLNHKIDLIVKTDGLLKDYIESVVLKKIKSGMAADIFDNVTPYHIRAALLLRNIEPCSLKEFATAMRLSKASASALVERMVQAGTVEREMNPDNRREVLVKVSPALEQHISYVHAELIKWFGSITEDMGVETVEKWYEVMNSLRSVLTDRLKNGDSYEPEGKYGVCNER
jgi:DNA-binding MarR family transcriptional regulator